MSASEDAGPRREVDCEFSHRLGSIKGVKTFS